MIGKVLSFLFVVAYMTNTSDALKCYSCGYLELINGTKIPLTEDYGTIPFCDDFAEKNETTVEASIGGCCSAYKVDIKDEKTGDTMWISRHGTASDEDEVIWNNFDCGETTDGYVCKNQHIADEGLEEDGRVCHCYEDLCNVEVPKSGAQRLAAVFPAVYFLLTYVLKEHTLTTDGY